MFIQLIYNIICGLNHILHIGIDWMLQVPVLKYFLVTTPTGNLSLCAQDLQADMSYPWPRTIEIYLQTTLFLREVQ